MTPWHADVFRDTGPPQGNLPVNGGGLPSQRASYTGFWCCFDVCLVVVITLFSNIIHEQKHQIQTWLIKHTQNIVNMYNFEGHQKKALAYLAGGSNLEVTIKWPLILDAMMLMWWHCNMCVTNLELENPWELNSMPRNIVESEIW